MVEVSQQRKQGEKMIQRKRWIELEYQSRKREEIALVEKRKENIN